MENKTTVAKNKDGYGYKYTDLAQIHEYLESNGMKYYQEIETVDGNDYIMTYRFIDGIWEEKPKRGCKIVDAVLNGIKNPAQEQGSAITYARRYSLLMAFGLATDDDDAACLSINKTPTKEDAEKYVISFGKHKGEKLSEVINDTWYKNYLLNGNDDYIKKCIELLTGETILIKEEQDEAVSLISKMNELVITTNTDYEKLLEHYGVKSNNDMTLDQLRGAVKVLERKS